MKAIILAAGLGKRLRPITDTKPKCMVEVAGSPLIDNILDGLKSAGVTKAYIVTGYLENMVREHLGSNFCGIDIEYVNNSIYDKTNNIYSLYLALKKVDDDIILSECDLYYKKEIFSMLLDKISDCTILTSKYNKETMDGTAVLTDKYGKPLSMQLGKHQNRYAAFDYEEAYKTVNVYYMSKNFAVNKLLPTMEQYINMYDKNSYYELCIACLMHYANDHFELVNVNEDYWAEVDDINDLKIAQKKFGG